MSKIHLEFESLDEMKGFIIQGYRDLNLGESPKTPKKVKDEDAEDKPVKKAKDEDAEEKPAKKVAKAKEETADKVTFEMVRESMLKLDGTDEEETIPAILEKFNVVRLSALKEKDFEKAQELFEKAYKRSSPLAGKD